MKRLFERIPLVGKLFRWHTTSENLRYWKNRKIDWVQSYLTLYDHPHRFYIAERLSRFTWLSLLEVGCASGPNLLHLFKSFPGRDIGGIDINKDAIEVARQVCERYSKQTPSKYVYCDVAPGNDIFMSDKSLDVILTDMTMIYVGPREIQKYIKEFRRVARKKIVMFELYSPSRWTRFISFFRGHHFHNYPKVLSEAGCYDIVVEKMPEGLWPESETQQKWAYIISASI